MTSISEISLMKGLPTDASDRALRVLSRAEKPLTMQEIVDGGGGPMSKMAQVLQLLNLRKQIEITNCGDPRSVVWKTYAVKA